MKKKIQWMFAAILICSAIVFTACKDEEKPVTPDLNVAEKIIGKWIVAARDGNPAPTNRKKVYTFVSATKAYITASITENQEAALWSKRMEADVVINGNKMTLTSHPDEHTTGVEEFIITEINDTDFTTNQKVIVTVDGRVVLSEDFALRFTKVTSDYSEAILGKWEGHVTSEQGSAFDDGEDHQWEYLADGTFRYYLKDKDGQWVTNPNQTLSKYFVDGVLLCTRWIIDGTENREWWEIESIENGMMKWKALRQNSDGSAYTATFQMKKVQ